MTTAILETLSAKLEESQPQLARLNAYFEGRQPAAFLSPQSREALGNRLRVLGINFPRLLVNSIAERLQVTGFKAIGADTADESLWRIWEANDMDAQAHLAHVDALTFGRSFVFIWTGPQGPLVTVESARQVAVATDPATGTVRAAVKRWQDGKDHHAIVYEADRITKYRGTNEHSMQTIDVIDNPLGEVPVVQIVNRARLLDFDGSSEMADILDLTDGLAKIMSDAMVSSEYFARPRRWVTGLEVVEDDDGNPINPFSNEADRLWQSEDPATKFGEFGGAKLDGYTELTSVLTQQIGAVSGLPPHYLGLNGDQPPSADAIRSAEASLVARTVSKQRTYGRAWAKVADLIVNVRDGQNRRDFETMWTSAETRTPAQVTDAASKLVGMGVPLESALADPMGYTPAQIEQVKRAKRAEMLDNAAMNLDAFLVDGPDS